MLDQKGGRPTAAEQEAIARKLKPYFEMGVSADFTASQPNMPNRTTIQRYFKNWKEKYLENEAPNITERQMEVRGQIVTVFDKMLFNLHAQLNKVIGTIQSYEKEWQTKADEAVKNKQSLPPNKLDMQLENKFTNLCKLIGEMVSVKASIEAAPYASEMTYSAVLKEMQENYEKRMKEKESKKNEK